MCVTLGSMVYAFIRKSETFKKRLILTIFCVVGAGKEFV